MKTISRLLILLLVLISFSTPVRAGHEQLPVGTVNMYIGSTAPSGWMNCDGTAISRTQYAELFAIIGTTYGAGDASTTFNLPDFRGRGPIGLGTGTGLTARSLGQSGGEESHLLTTAEMPAHSHNLQALEDNAGVTDPAGNVLAQTFMYKSGTTDVALHASSISSSGGGSSHNVMNPYAVVNFIIKTSR